MTLELKHSFTLIVAGPSSFGKSTSVIRLLECNSFENIVWCHSEINASHHLKIVSFVKGVPDLENPENILTLIVLDDLMECLFYNSEPIIYQTITTS